MLGWFHAIMPKEEKFFDLFARHSQAVVAGAEALRAMLDGGDAVPRHYRTIMDREQDADNVTREVLIAVRRTFITPFDRGDIQDLITSMDNSIDQMQKTAKGIVLFDVTEFAPEMKEMADAIVKCAQLVKQAVPMLQSLHTQAAPLSALTIGVLVNAEAVIANTEASEPNDSIGSVRYFSRSAFTSHCLRSLGPTPSRSRKLTARVRSSASARSSADVNFSVSATLRRCTSRRSLVVPLSPIRS